MSDLIRTLTADEQQLKGIECDWTWRDDPPCVRLPEFRLATPHGHMDFCTEHIDYMIVALPQEWLEGFAYREPEPLVATDNIPF